ncbi:MAG: hypothetical protein IJB88_03575, partial [Clostridia bacterium]|nr:hypothetical protein [Clostridia bacterium]
AYLNSVEASTEDSDAGFLKSMTFAYIKDLSYKRFHYDLDGFATDDYVCSVSKVIGRLNRGKIITSLQTYTESTHGRVSVSGFRYPWNRKFEMTFDIKVR